MKILSAKHKIHAACHCEEHFNGRATWQSHYPLRDCHASLAMTIESCTAFKFGEF
jgi:hypothetical protein